MSNASEVVKKVSSIKRAAEEYRVPKTTLQDQVLGNDEHGKKPGQQLHLNVEEEKNLDKCVEVVDDIGFNKIIKQIKAMVEKTACEKTF